MLNSTTNNRLREDLDSRRRSSTKASNNILRQVNRIYNEDDDFYSDDSEMRKKEGHLKANSPLSNSSLHGLKLSESSEDGIIKSLHSSPSDRYNLTLSKKRHWLERRKTGVRYSISSRVHPSATPVDSAFITQQIGEEGHLNGRTTHLTTEGRRGSRALLRYSILKRISSHGDGPKENNFHSDDSTRSNIRNDSLVRLTFDPSLDHRFQAHLNQIKRPRFVILPSNKFRVGWDVFMAGLLSILAFYIPFRFCMYFYESSSRSSGIFWFELTVDVIFGCDILINFISAYHDPTSKCLVCSPKRIAMKYLKGYFAFDLIASFPITYILSSSSENVLVANKLGKLTRLPKMVRFLKAVRLLKLLRVYRLRDFITRLETEYNIHHGITRMIKILATVLLVTHLAGCFWHLIGLTSGEDDKDGGWIYRYSYQDKSIPARYVASLYFAFSTLTTVGYGDISARGVGEQAYSMLMMLVGVSWYAYIVSSMATVLSSFDATAAAVRDKMVCVNEFIRVAKLPPQLGKQVRSYFEFKLANSQRVFLMNKHYDADEILYELSSSLRTEIMLFMEKDLVARIPFFHNKVNQFVADAVALLQPIVCHEGEYIVKEGSQADEMFFLTKGKAAVFYGSKHVYTLHEGEFFGELGCLVGGIRRAGVKAMTTCELQALSRRNLNTLIVEYPDIGDELKKVAKDRAKAVKKDKISHASEAPHSGDIETNHSSYVLSNEVVDRYLQETMEELKNMQRELIESKLTERREV